MSRLYSRLRRLRRDVDLMLSRQRRDLPHLDEMAMDALLWEAIERAGSMEALQEKARSKGMTQFADFLPVFVAQCPRPAWTRSASRPEFLFRWDILPPDQYPQDYFSVPVEELCYLLEGRLPQPWPWQGGPNFDTTYLTEDQMDALIWEGIDLIGGIEAVADRLREDGRADLAAALPDFLASEVKRPPKPTPPRSNMDWLLACCPPQVTEEDLAPLHTP